MPINDGVPSQPEYEPQPTLKTSRLPGRFENFLPTGISRRVFPEAIPTPPPPPSTSAPDKQPPTIRRVHLRLPRLNPKPNIFRTYRQYRELP